MTDFTAYLRLGVDSRDAVTAEKNLDKMTGAANDADKAFKSLGGASKLLASALASVGVAVSASEVIKYADAWTNVNNVLTGVTKSQSDLAITQSKIVELSKQTFSSLEGTAGLYSELSRSVSELGISQDRLIGVTRTINNLFLAGGKSAEEASGAIRQLNQGLAAGALRGDEFNSVAEGAPRILDALSMSLNVSKGELRDFAATGGITSKILITSLEQYSNEAQKAVDTTKRTFSQNSELAKTFVTEYVGNVKILNDFTQKAGESLVGLASSLGTIQGVVTSLAQGFAIALIPALVKYSLSVSAVVKEQLLLNTVATRTVSSLGVVTTTAASATVAQNAIALSSRAAATAMGLLGGPIGAITLAAGALIYFSTKSSETEKAAEKLAGSADQATESYKKLGAAQKELAKIGLSQELSAQEAEISKLNKIISQRESATTNVGRGGGGGLRSSSDSTLELKSRLESAKQSAAGLKEKLDAINGVDLSKAKNQIDSLMPTIEFKSLEDITDDVMRYANASMDALDAETARAKTIKDLNDQMSKEAYLIGNTSKEVEIQYEIKNKLIKATEKEASGLIAAAKALDNYARANQEAKDHAALMGDTVDEINKSFDELNKSNLDRISNDITVFTEKATDGQKKIDEAAKRSSESLRDNITDALLRGFENGKDIAENFKDTLENIFKTMVLRPVFEIATDQLSKQLSSIIGTAGTKGADGKTTGASGLIGAAGPYALYAAAAVAAVNIFNKEQEKGFEKLTSAYRQGTQSLGTVLGESGKKSESISNAISYLGDTASSTLDVNYGMYQTLLDIKTGISGAAAGFARQIGVSGVGNVAANSSSTFNQKTINALGGSGLAITNLQDKIGGNAISDFLAGFTNALASKIASVVYSKKTTITDSGIKILGTSLADILTKGTIDAFTYADIKTTKSFLGIKYSIKSKEQLNDLDSIFEAQFAGIFKSAGDALEQAAKTFGSNFDASKFTVSTTNLSLKGLEGDALTKEIENFFSATLDNWAGVLTYGTDVLTKYQQVGEGAFETVVRLSAQTNTFASYAEKLNFNFSAIGLTAIDTVQNIAKLSGGFDQLGSSLSAYYQNFFSDSERTAAGLSQIGEQLKTVGIDTVPKTREAFRALLEDPSLDLASESGQKYFATLISLSGAFAQLVPATKDAVQTTEDLAAAHQKYVESLKDSASSALDGLSKSISAEKERINLIVSNASAAKSALDSAIENEKEKLKSVADQKISAINAQADAEKTAQEAINKARIDSLKEQQSAVADSIKTMTNLVDNINGTIYDMAVNSDALTASRRRAAQFEIDTAIANVRAGRGAGDISGALSTLRQNPAQLYSSAKELAYATAVTQNKLAELAKLTGANITDSQKQLDILNAQLANSESFTAIASSKYDQMISVAQGQYDADIASLDAMKANAQSQFDKLTGIDTTVLGLNEAFKKYNESLLAADFENAQAQNAKLDDQLAKSEAQLNALLGIDNSVLSLKDSVDKFLAAISVLNKEVNKDNLDALNAVAAQIQNLRDEQRAQSLKQVAAMETTARNTTSLVIDSVPA